MHKILFAAFRDRANADRTFAELENHGFAAQDLSIITKDEGVVHEHSTASNTAIGAVEGATTGGIIGGIAGFLAGAGIVPALAGLIIAGPFAAALGLTGVAAATVAGAVTGAAAGGLLGALLKFGFSQTDAEYYERTVNEGGLLLAVHVNADTVEEARALLEANGAEEMRLITPGASGTRHVVETMTASEAARTMRKSTSAQERSLAAERLEQEREHAAAHRR